ncbi:hypothetical protein [Caudoviricetes sp.]|nr:hypothetical protein [Caudoviricetes sp.]
MSDDFIHIKTGESYEKITHINGVQTTVCANRFEIITRPTTTVHEDNAVQALRDWIRWRNAQVMQMSGDMPE